MFKFKDCYVGYLNLSHRTDRLQSITEEFKRVGIEAVRHAGKLPNEVDQFNPRYRAMQRRTPGAIGCHLGQVEIMKTALMQGRHAVVFEDDSKLCVDFNERIAYIEKWMETHSWDIFWLGSSVHIGGPWWHRKGHRERELEDCTCTLGRDAETTDDPRILRTYGAFVTFAYIVHKDSIQKVLDLLDVKLETSIGIDFQMIRIQPQLNCFCFVPGLVRQMTNQSDIGTGITNWDGFLQLNGTFENSAYVWQDKLTDFNPTTFQWKEAQK